MSEPIKQPEVLWLADILQYQLPSIECLEKAAAELRRLHGEVERLRADHATLLDNASIEVRRLRAESNKMEAEVERLRVDAERYRHLCEYQRWTPEIEAAFDCSPKVLIDEAIDNSIKAMKELTK
jgi:hypothetical protein